nr:hypothetical protein [Steroidobacter gossypii]
MNPFFLESILDLLVGVRVSRQQRDLLVGALDPRAQGGTIRIVERYSNNRRRLEHRADLTSRIAFFDSLNQAARNPCAIRKLLCRHPTLLARKLDLLAEQCDGLPTDSGEWAYLGFWHNLIHT